MLASRIRLLDHRHHLPRLDDGHGQPSQPEPIRPMSPHPASSRPFSNFFFPVLISSSSPRNGHIMQDGRIFHSGYYYIFFTSSGSGSGSGGRLGSMFYEIPDTDGMHSMRAKRHCEKCDMWGAFFAQTKKQYGMFKAWHNVAFSAANERDFSNQSSSISQSDPYFTIHDMVT